MQKKVLVVDDEAAIRSLMTVALGRAGYDVHVAESAEAALELINDQQILVYFLDLNLPGMNGIELCRRIRKENPFAVVYAVTGYASTFEVHECREAGFEDYFTKPVELKLLLGAAEQAFMKLARWKSENRHP